MSITYISRMEAFTFTEDSRQLVRGGTRHIGAEGPLTSCRSPMLCRAFGAPRRATLDCRTMRRRVRPADKNEPCRLEP